MTEWTPQAFSSNSTPVAVDEALLDEEVVIYMTGKNIYGDPTYAYIKLTLRNLQKLKMAMDNDDQFMPSDFGTVLAAGRGEPSEEIRAETALTYNLVDIPKPITRAPRPAANFAQPSMWDEN
jgi:hypothetical protein